MGRLYSFTLRLGNQFMKPGIELPFDNDVDAIESAQIVVRAVFINNYGKENSISSASIAIASGSVQSGENLRWLGEWEWQPSESSWSWLPYPALH
jgi:hypothetical protein